MRREVERMWHLYCYSDYHLFFHGLLCLPPDLFGRKLILAAVEVHLDLAILALLHLDGLGSLIEGVVPPLELKFFGSDNAFI